MKLYHDFTSREEIDLEYNMRLTVPDTERWMEMYGQESAEARRELECEMDVRPGGAWSTVMANDEGMRLTVSGVYREITPPERLVMTWGWHQEDGSRGHEPEIEVTLEDAPEGTRMRLVQSVFTSLEDRDNHNQGWQSTFKKLDLVFA